MAGNGDGQVGVEGVKERVRPVFMRPGKSVRQDPQSGEDYFVDPSS